MEVRLRDDLASLTPYDPDMREVEVMLSANENSYGLPEEVRAAMAARLAEVPAHRYPEADPDPAPPYPSRAAPLS